MGFAAASEMHETRPFDIIIIGGGSFGSVLAQSCLRGRLGPLRMQQFGGSAAEHGQELGSERVQAEVGLLCGRAGSKHGCVS